MPSEIMKYFKYAHLPAALKGISHAVAVVADLMDTHLPDGAEKAAGLRKLLEAKDCFVRSAVDMPHTVKIGQLSDDLIRKANLDLEQYAEKQGWIEPTPVDVLQREEVKNYIIGTSKDFDSSAQVHFVRLTLQDGAISSGMHPNPMIAEEKATIAAIEYSVKKGWIEKVSPYFSFSKALELLKQDQKITRKGWNGKDQWLSVSCNEGKTVPAESFWSSHNLEFAHSNGGSAKVMPCITLKNAQDQIVMGWIPSTGDLFAEDWMIAQ